MRKGYGTMETAVSLPEQLFIRAEEYAKKHGLSRNELYVKAVSEYIRKKDKQEDKDIVQTINKICDNLDTSLNPQMRAAAIRTLSSSKW
jgi:metal-responsive CopG/Arc/MetJ family transcriptional regulator